MHLAEIVGLRQKTGAGLLLALTGRCPLSCAHCSTSSDMGSAEYDGWPFRRLTSSFSAADHPQVMVMSGGEPLLRADLVAELAAAARAVGTRSCVLSGMFFVRGGRAIPASIRSAISGLDHFAVSIDRYHEREVARTEVFAALRELMSWVPHISVHITAAAGDAYVDGVVSEVRREFADRVPMLVTRLQPTGRAVGLLQAAGQAVRTSAGPCGQASWPLVDYDGTVYACSRQSLVRRSRPGHLVLGHASRDPWAILNERTKQHAVLQAIRTIGPVGISQRLGGVPAANMCDTCTGLSDDSAIAARVSDYVSSRPGQACASIIGRFTAASRPRQVAARLGAGAMGDLVELGWD